MRSEKSATPRQSTKKKLQEICGYRSSGQVEWVMGMFGLLFLMVLGCFELQLCQYYSTAGYLEDALAASGLAAAVIDVESYGIDHSLVIPDAMAAYGLYQKSLGENLELTGSGQCINSSVMSGPVTIEEFWVYNVRGDQVYAQRVDRGTEESSMGKLGEVKAPNGKVVRSTGVYGEISFPVEGFLGVYMEARKGKLVEVAAKERSMGE